MSIPFQPCVIRKITDLSAVDHYFGTMAGVRGFKDPNVQINNGQSVWYQKTGNLSSKTNTLLPWSAIVRVLR
jgi:phospholipase C